MISCPPPQLKHQMFHFIYTPAVRLTLTPPPWRPSNDGTELKRTNLPLDHCEYEHWRSSHFIINFISCVDLWAEIMNKSGPRRTGVHLLQINTAHVLFRSLWPRGGGWGVEIIINTKSITKTRPYYLSEQKFKRFCLPVKISVFSRNIVLFFFFKLPLIIVDVTERFSQ